VSIFEKNESLLFVVSRVQKQRRRKKQRRKRTNINASAKVPLHELFEHLLRSRIVAIVRSFVSFSSRNVLSFSLHRQLGFNVSNEISHRPSRIFFSFFFSSSSFATRAAAAQNSRRCHLSSLSPCVYLSARARAVPEREKERERDKKQERALRSFLKIPNTPVALAFCSCEVCLMSRCRVFFVFFAMV